ncbi:hypothetical protein HFN98_18000 [Rhizobium laguerreae]|uniref:hypothetical protein n=1 Tax=Rhizobium laguerreae TaxID=1076926 RepID=UPI001C914CDC|nr:hypothetical protein [Rhizobium laguerreae]MBY3332503.1 hypothetical protein [Rhizobium laguerreae]
MKPTETLEPDELVYELLDLEHILDAIYDVLRNMEYVKADGSRNVELDRVAALHRITRSHVAWIARATHHFDIPGAYVPGTSKETANA